MTEAPKFDVSTPLGFTVRCSRSYWEFLIQHKHPVLAGHEREVERALADPDEVRRSRKDPMVLLFYRGSSPRWMCAVVRPEGAGGFLITAYPTDAIKVGERTWTRSG